MDVMWQNAVVYNLHEEECDAVSLERPCQVVVLDLTVHLWQTLEFLVFLWCHHHHHHHHHHQHQQNHHHQHHHHHQQLTTKTFFSMPLTLTYSFGRNSFKLLKVMTWLIETWLKTMTTCLIDWNMIEGDDMVVWNMIEHSCEHHNRADIIHN